MRRAQAKEKAKAQATAKTKTKAKAKAEAEATTKANNRGSCLSNCRGSVTASVPQILKSSNATRSSATPNLRSSCRVAANIAGGPHR